MTPVVPDFDDYPIQHLPTALQMTAEALVVTWDDGAESTYPLLWLREYSLDPVTFNHQTREQNLAIIDLPDTVSLSSASIATNADMASSISDDGDAIILFVVSTMIMVSNFSALSHIIISALLTLSQRNSMFRDRKGSGEFGMREEMREK